MYETTEEVLQDALEGVLIAFQMLLLHLDKTRAIDAREYAGMLLDFRTSGKRLYQNQIARLERNGIKKLPILDGSIYEDASRFYVEVWFWLHDYSPW